MNGKGRFGEVARRLLCIDPERDREIIGDQGEVDTADKVFHSVKPIGSLCITEAVGRQGSAKHLTMKSISTFILGIAVKVVRSYQSLIYAICR